MYSRGESRHPRANARRLNGRERCPWELTSKLHCFKVLNEPRFTQGLSRLVTNFIKQITSFCLASAIPVLCSTYCSWPNFTCEVTASCTENSCAYVLINRSAGKVSIEAIPPFSLFRSQENTNVVHTSCLAWQNLHDDQVWSICFNFLVPFFSENREFPCTPCQAHSPQYSNASNFKEEKNR